MWKQLKHVNDVLLSSPHEEKIDWYKYPRNYVYVLYLQNNFHKKDLDSSSVAKKRIKV